jgi:putative isomerase
MTLFDHQDETGVIPDSIADTERIWTWCKPPIHGWALRKLMDQPGVVDDARKQEAYGLATELPGSAYYTPDGYWRGPIWAPSTMLIVDGLHSLGEDELVHDIVTKFANMVSDGEFAENFAALTGQGLRDPAYTWTSSVFLILAHEYLS